MDKLPGYEKSETAVQVEDTLAVLALMVVEAVKAGKKKMKIEIEVSAELEDDDKIKVEIETEVEEEGKKECKEIEYVIPK